MHTFFFFDVIVACVLHHQIVFGWIVGQKTGQGKKTKQKLRMSKYLLIRALFDSLKC